jgi:hypothetical protein
VLRIVNGIKPARKRIYNMGGPAIFVGNGATCEQCQESVEQGTKQAQSSPMFQKRRIVQYQTRYWSAQLPLIDGIMFGNHPMPIYGTSHNWGEIQIDGHPIVTIDFWTGGHDYWRPGKKSFGWPLIGQ